MKRILLGLGSVSVLFAAVVSFVSLVYIPRQVVYAARYPITESPADVGIAYEDVTIRPADEPIELQGWWMPAAEPVATLVFIHGGSSNRHTSYFKALDFYRAMVERHVSVFTIDLRNHGASDAASEGITFGLSEKEDAKAAIAWAREKAPGLPLYAMGISMGGATLVYALADDPVVDGLILLDPLLDTESCLQNAVYAETGIPPALVAPSAWSAVTFFGLPGRGAEAGDVAQRLELPMLLIQDPGDPVTESSFARALAPLNPNIDLWLAPEADPEHPELEWKGRWGSHVSAFDLYPEPTLGKIMGFIQAGAGR